MPNSETTPLVGQNILSNAPPLFLPNGSIRSLIAVLFTAFMLMMLWAERPVPETYWSVYTMIITFYFMKQQPTGTTVVVPAPSPTPVVPVTEPPEPPEARPIVPIGGQPSKPI